MAEQGGPPAKKQGGAKKNVGGTKKTSLKLKMNRGKDAPAKANATKPKVSLKLKRSDSGTGTTQAKPRLKLSLSKKSSSSVASSSAPSRGKVPPAAAETSSTTTAAAPKPKINVRLGNNSRGKELPTGVSPESKSTKSTTSSKKATKPRQKRAPAKKKDDTKKTAPPPAVAPKASSSSGALEMNAKRKEQCMKVLAGLKRRQEKNYKWFKQPVSDKAIVDDYRAKIPNAMDLGTMATKLEKNQYRKVPDFVLDLRRVFANCLRYNTTGGDEYRAIAVEMLWVAEELMAHFIGKYEQPHTVYPPLLYCWKICISIIDTLLNMKNPTDGHQTAHYFLHPVSFYCGGTLPPGYETLVQRPMDLGTITSQLLEGTTQSIEAFTENCNLVIKNCLTFHEHSEGGALFTEQAGRLNILMSQQLRALKLYDQSPDGMDARNNAVSWKTVKLATPPPPVFLTIINEMRALKYTDRATKISEPAMAPFEKPVNLTAYPDYLQFCQTPMDLQTIEQRVKSGLYEAPEDFEYDVGLIFRNCAAYNVPRQSEHLIALGKNGAKMFRRIFVAKMKSFENPEPKPQVKAEPQDVKSENKRAISPSAQLKAAKKVRIEAPARPSIPGSAAPRISIQSAGKGPRSKSPRPPGGGKQKKPASETNEEVPLHVAIAQIKERFPLRRPYKLLESWEGARPTSLLTTQLSFQG